MVLVQFVLEQGLPQRHLHLALAGMVVLPPVKPHVADDLVDVVDDPLDDDRGLVVLGFLEQPGQSRLAKFLVCNGLGRLLSGDEVPSEVKERFQELDARQQALLVTLLQGLEALAESLEGRVVQPLSEAPCDLEFDFLGLGVWVRRSEHGLQ